MRIRSALLVTCAGLSLLVGPLVAPSAAAAPTAQGWWSSAHQGVQPPAPPDVPEDGLLVQGAAAQPLAPTTPGLGGTPAEPVSVQALSALAFAVPPGAVVRSLVLEVAGESPEATTVSACAVTGPYEPVQNGEFAKRPPFDCTTSVVPVLDAAAGTLTFGSDLAALVEDDVLSIVLLPGGVDRLALQKPGATALVLSGGATGSSRLPPVPSGSPSGAAPVSEDPAAGSGFDSAGPPLSPGLGGSAVAPAPFDSLDVPAAAAPEVAVPLAQQAPVLGGPRTGPTSLTGQPGVDGTARTVLLLGLLAVAGALVLSSRQRGAVAGPAAPTPIPPQERGIGRFRQVRDSRAVPL